MSKTVFSDTPPTGTIVTAAFLNAVNNHRHTGADEDGAGALDYAISTGSANAYVLALSPALAAHVAGMSIRIKANFTNTGAATLNINSLGAIAIKRPDGSALQANDILSGSIITVTYDGTYYQLAGAVSIYPSGSVRQVVNYQNGWLDGTSIAMPSGDAIPQNTDGREWGTLRITPKSALNKLLIQVDLRVTAPDNGSITSAALFRDNISDALAAGGVSRIYSGGFVSSINFNHFMVAETTNQITFKIRYGPSTAGVEVRINGTDGGIRLYGGVCSSSITITEIQS